MTESTTQPDQPLEFVAEIQQTRPLFSNSTNAHFGYENWLLDFLFNFNNQATLVSRISLTPSHIKNLTGLLVRQIKEYEDKFGVINTEAQ